MGKTKNGKIKTAIIVLSVLLFVSLVALAVFYINGRLKAEKAVTVAVPDNFIAQSSETAKNETSSDDVYSADVSESEVSGTELSQTVTASGVSLYAKHPEDNESFDFSNMFPGDSVKKNFCVLVSYKGNVTVHYKATLKSGDSELLSALNIRIRMLKDDTVMYDGPISDMPQSVTYKLSSDTAAETELYYEIITYLGTDVGNEYQSKSVVADFEWWAEEEENLLPNPVTGDTQNIVFFAVTACVCAVLCVALLLIHRRKEEKENV